MVGGYWTSASAQPQHAAHQGDTPGIHNMLVFGDKTVFLSHFPMFQQVSQDGTRFATKHRFQLIMEVEFRTPQGQDATTFYRQARQQHPEVRMYSLKPETLVLQDLFAPPSGGQPRRSFAAGVFFDHLERGGKPVPGLEVELDQEPTKMVVQVKRVLHVHEFRPADASPADLEYILFGRGEELFLAHLIAAPADFDQILPVGISGRSFSNEELNRGFRIRLKGRPNTAADRLREQPGLATGLIRAANAPNDSDKPPAVNESTIKIEPRREIYFEEDELRTLPSFGQTALERDAGF